MEHEKIVHRLCRSEHHPLKGWPWPVYDHDFMDGIFYSKAALSWYKKRVKKEEEDDVEYQVVGQYPYTRQIDVIIPSIDERLADWIHICFLAKPRRSNINVKPTLFFAELAIYSTGRGRPFRVSHCSIIPNPDDDPGITFECGICDPSKRIPHPSNYLVGHWPYQMVKYLTLSMKAIEMHGSSEGRRLDLTKIFKGTPPLQYVWRMKSHDFADLALELHKKGQDCEFELVDALDSHHTIRMNRKYEDWVHVSFTAKPKNGDGDDVSPKLFFAELVAFGGDEHYSLVQCSMLEPNHPETTYECQICDPKKNIAHPREYEAGKISARPHLGDDQRAKPIAAVLQQIFEPLQVVYTEIGPNPKRKIVHPNSRGLKLEDPSTSRFVMDLDKIVYRSDSDSKTGWPVTSWDKDVYYNQWICHAETALNWYEKDKGVEFELVGLYPYTRKNYVIIPSIDDKSGDWVHICFFAKPIGERETTDDVEPKLFFAELVYYSSLVESRVAHCSILDPNDPGITYECGICDPSMKIPHCSKHLVGHWPYQNGEIPDSVYESHWFLEEIPGSSKGPRQLDLNKLFNGNVPAQYVRRKMKSGDFAELALELHNKGQDVTELELVEALDSHRSILLGETLKMEDWVHVSFTAKAKNDDVPKLFFAELLACGAEKQYSLAQCSILDLNQPGITYKCRICDPKKKIAHPDEYLAAKLQLPSGKRRKILM